MRDGIEEGSPELSAVGFGTGALIWAEAWAFIVEGGGGVVRDVQGVCLQGGLDVRVAASMAARHGS